MKKNKIKAMPYEQFKDVLQRKWHPVKLEGDKIPDFLENIPKDKLNSVYASGDSLAGISYSDETIPSGDIIGGIDVYRNSPDDPFVLNRDWYPVIAIPKNKAMLLIKGPIKEKDKHWMNEIPERLRGVEILAVPKKSKK